MMRYINSRFTYFYLLSQFEHCTYMCSMSYSFVCIYPCSSDHGVIVGLWQACCNDSTTDVDRPTCSLVAARSQCHGPTSAILVRTTYYVASTLYGWQSISAKGCNQEITRATCLQISLSVQCTAQQHWTEYKITCMSGLRYPVQLWKIFNDHNSATRHLIDFVFRSRIGVFSKDGLALLNFTAHESRISLHELCYDSPT